METIFIIGLLLVVFILIKLWLGKKSAGHLPPGPPGKFLIGNLLDLNLDRLHISFTDIGREYGDVFSVQTGGKTIVVINTIEAFRELYTENRYGEKLDGRERTFVAQVIAGDMGIPVASNTPGRKQRRAAINSAVKNFTSRHQLKLQEEITHLVELLGTKGDEPQDVDRPVQLYLTIANLMMLTGERYDYDDPRLLTLIQRANLVQTFIRPRVNSVMTMFPWLRHLPFGYGQLYQQYVSVTQKLKETIYDPMKDSYHPGDIRGGIDEMIKVQKETLGNLAAELTDDYLNMSALSVIGAGIGVQIGNLLYFIVVILNRPEIAEKLRKEMDSVLGRFRCPTLADRPRLPYAEAVVWELLRWGSPAPVLVPRRAEVEIQFRGYTIPKDATVITNAWKILHDESLWSGPWEFRPARFIGPNGELLRDLQENVIAFGAGRRICLGAYLAFDLAFLYVTSLVQRFDFQAVNGELPPLDPHLHTTSRVGIKPEPFKVIVRRRN